MDYATKKAAYDNDPDKMQEPLLLIFQNTHSTKNQVKKEEMAEVKSAVPYFSSTRYSFMTYIHHIVLIIGNPKALSQYIQISSRCYF